MARFIFTLDPLLRARRAAERERQRAVAVLERERLAIEARLRRQQAMIDENRHALRKGLIGAIDAIALRSHAASSMRLMRDAQRMAVELATVHQRKEAARADLTAAAAACRAMELLRDRQYEQWKRKQAKREEAAMDELATTKAAMRREAVL